MFAPVSARVTISAPVSVTVPSACSCATVSDSTLSVASMMSIPVPASAPICSSRERRNVRAGVCERDNIRRRQSHCAKCLLLCNRQRQHVVSGIDDVDTCDRLTHQSAAAESAAMFAPVSARVTISALVSVTVPSACSCATVSDSTLSAGIDDVDAFAGERTNLSSREGRNVRASVCEGDNIRPGQRHCAERLLLCNRQRQHVVSGINIVDAVSRLTHQSAPPRGPRCSRRCLRG